VGPQAGAGPTRTASREKLFICKPEVREQERACGRTHHDRSRRACLPPPVTKEDVSGLMAFYDSGHEGSGGFEAGIEQMVTAVLASPDFLYRRHRPAEG